MQVLFLFGLTLMSSGCWAEPARLLSQDFIDEINSKQSTWIAGRNFPETTTIEYLRNLNGLLGPHRDPSFTPEVVKHRNGIALPENFDGREAWPYCESLNDIRDQGECGGCWAFGAAESMTDRLCIHTNGGTKFTFSAEDLMTCCTNCGFGCTGGYLLEAWQFWNTTGIVSGGEVGSDKGCRPFDQNAYDSGETPLCNPSCIDTYEISYEDDKHFGVSAYQVASTVEDIQTEILMNGPVEATFLVYEDLYVYQSGVYQHVSGEKIRYHGIKLIGWGIEEGVPYWLIANSWGTGWGMGGFYKSLRGENHCAVEQGVYAGMPNIF